MSEKVTPEETDRDLDLDSSYPASKDSLPRMQNTFFFCLFYNLKKKGGKRKIQINKIKKEFKVN